MAKNDLELEERVTDMAKRLRYINASDLTAIARGMPYQPHFDDEYIAKLRAGGVTALHASLAVWFYDTFPASMRRVGAVLRFLEENTKDLVIVRTADDVLRAEKEGKIGIVIHFHNTTALDDDLTLVGVYHKLGLRCMQLTYQGRSFCGDGCAEPSPGGLSSFGIRVVEEMNRFGIIVDVAHAGERTFMEAIEASKYPVISSHGSVKGVHDHPRNVSDKQLEAIARKGGVFGIMAKSDTLRPNGAVDGSTLDDYLKHVDYVAKRVGADHVAIGLENGYKVNDVDLLGLQADGLLRFDKPYERGRVPKNHIFERYYSAVGVDDPSIVKKNVIRGLLKLGYKEADIAKILGENMLRVYRQVWKT
jgi:membrane dipeptidase